MWIWFILIMTTIYTTTNYGSDYCEYPLWVWVLFGAVCGYLFNQNNLRLNLGPVNANLGMGNMNMGVDTSNMNIGLGLGDMNIGANMGNMNMGANMGNMNMGANMGNSCNSPRVKQNVDYSNQSCKSPSVKSVKKSTVKTCNNTEEDFDNSSNITVYNFNTSWCGWSRNFQPEWDLFMTQVSKMKNVTAIDVKCDDKTDEDVQKLCKKFNIPGYPYVMIETNNVAKPYEGERTAASLLAVVKNL